ncbi:UNC93-like protein MFSD11 [Lampetra fluviatilis]
MTEDKKKLINVLILGFAFMFVFTAFQTCGNVEQTVINNLSTNFSGSGYTSLAIIYGVFSASNILAPSVVAVLGPRWSMVLGGIVYSAYIATFIKPMAWSFYTASVLIGIAAAVLWTAQGTCLTVNSDATTMARNSGIFWALLQFSMVFGNLYIYVSWKGKTHISDKDRRVLFTALTVISLVGTLVLVLVRKSGTQDSALSDAGDTDEPCDQNETTPQRETPHGPLQALKNSVKLFFTRNMLLLSVCMAYTGLELTFFSGVYGTCIGATNRFVADAKGLIGLSGIFIGVGEITGGGLFGLLNRNNRFGRNPVVLLGMVAHIIAFFLIFLNIPDDAPVVGEAGSNKIGFMNPSVEVAMLCSFLLGFGDSCFNTQLYSVLGYMYADDSAPAFAVFKFVQSITAAIAFFYSNYLHLTWQLLVLVVTTLLGTGSFMVAEWQASVPSHVGYGRI